MKKILFAALVAALSFAATTLPAADVKAQSTKKIVSDTSVSGAASIATFSNVPSKLKSLSTRLSKVSGTIAGKIYLEATVLGDWELVDSLTLADKAVNFKTFFISTTTGTTYLSYRFRYAATGTPTAQMTSGYLRRTDE